MEIFKNFGFQPEFFFAQIVNFLVLAFVFKKFLYKPILKALRDRAEKIRLGIEDAEKSHLALEKANTQKDEIIKKASSEADKIIAMTKGEAESIKSEIVLSAKNESNRIISEAKIQAQAEFEKAEIEAKKIALTISEQLLDKIISEMFTKEEKEKILKRNIQKLENNG